MIRKDIGFILKRFNFGETSVIATIYSQKFGKIKGIFKGFYTQKKEFSTTLDTFSLNEFVFYPKESEIWLVSQAQLIADFSYLRKDIKKAKVAGLIFTLLDKTMQLWDKNRRIFDLTLLSTKLIEKDQQKAFFIFLIKFLTLAGIKPEFNHCIVCQKLIKGALFFSTQRGGLLCRSCCLQSRDYRLVSQETSKIFSYIQNNSIESAQRLQLSLRCQQEIVNITKKFLLYHFDFSSNNYPRIRDKNISSKVAVGS